jgi:hypothetical protein
MVGIECQSGCLDKKKGLAYQPGPIFFVARPARFELATYGFVVRHSIQLSYGRMQNGLKVECFISYSDWVVNG